MCPCLSVHVPQHTFRVIWGGIIWSWDNLKVQTVDVWGKEADPPPRSGESCWARLPGTPTHKLWDFSLLKDVARYWHWLVTCAEKNSHKICLGSLYSGGGNKGWRWGQVWKLQRNFAKISQHLKKTLLGLKPHLKYLKYFREISLTALSVCCHKDPRSSFPVFLLANEETLVGGGGGAENWRL